MKPQQTQCDVTYAGTLHTASGNNREANGYQDFRHQNEAQKDLSNAIMKNGQDTFFSGILAIPTGGGKTFIAAEWLLKNWIAKGKKILWIAHRHELLDQAFLTFYKNCYTGLLNNKKTISYRIISGQHDKPVHIKPDDDIIIASKDSLNYGMEYLIKKWIFANDLDELFLVIDEAHHSTAKTYRKLINSLKENIKYLKILGLTATPFRATDKESGLLNKIFPNDIIYKTDLRTLISRGILSEPFFVEQKTKWQAVKDVKEADFAKIKKFDLPEDVKRTIAGLKERNSQIVDHYFQNKEKYEQLLVFALNQNHAVALSALFNEKGKEFGIIADFVISNVQAEGTRHSLSKENKKKIEKFRNGELQVLINVNIVTEGTDLPNVQTVFLTRPTISRVLMMQMIGRALRGLKAGGTEKAFIVSFIDDWEDKIVLVNPEKLYLLDNVDFNDTDKETEKRFIQLISIEKLSEFALIADKTVDTNALTAIDFLDRIPVGIYAFSLLEAINGHENVERNCEILIYSHIEYPYSSFISDLPDILKKMNIDVENRETLTNNEIIQLCMYVESKYFNNDRGKLGFLEDDIKDVLLYYFDKQEKPQFIPFKDRERYDIDSIAREIEEKDLGPRKRAEFENKLWDNEQTAWGALFGYNKQYFINEIGLALRKIVHGHSLFSQSPDSLPLDKKEQRQYEDMTLSELREHVPEYFQKINDQVYKKFTNQNGQYFSAISGYTSKSKLVFEIDHIKPFSKGGKTTLDNLQLVTWWENRNKGDKEEQQKTEQDKGMTEKKVADLLKAAKKGDADAQNEIALFYYIGEGGLSEDFSQAAKWYREAAKQGHAESQNSLAFLHLNGQGVKKNDKLAFKWFKKAADQGDPDGQNNLALMYQDGQGVKKSYEEAFVWHKKAADQGDPYGQNYLGVLYDFGNGIPKDLVKAVELYQKAAEQGHPAAQSNLGLKYYYGGKGIKKDYTKAAYWYRQCAEQGDIKAQKRLGRLYAKGLGVSQDYIEAYAWFNLAYEQGNQNAKEVKEVEKKLTKAQLQKAVKKANEYRKIYES